MRSMPISINRPAGPSSPQDQIKQRQPACQPAVIRERVERGAFLAAAEIPHQKYGAGIGSDAGDQSGDPQHPAADNSAAVSDGGVEQFWKLENSRAEDDRRR